jgi:DNA-binding transcriptional LysR family regulator
VPETPEDLRDFPCAVFDSPYLSPWRFRNPGTEETLTVGVVPRLLVLSPDAAVDAAIDGIGATLVLEHDVAEAVKAGKLQFILQAYEVEPLPVHLVHISRHIMPAKLRHFIDFAVPKLRAELASFGHVPGI